MAECSASTAANSNHDVFISHRGPEVKKTFASHLYRRLLSCGLRSFLDQPELQAGEPFPGQIENAIKSASVHVAIFSPGYADSRWCLDELVQMLDSKMPIIPVFYNVKPAELRWTRGKKTRYAEALETLEKKTDYDPQIGTEYDPQTGKRKLRYDSSMIEKWRTALSNVADITGFELEACNGDEGELVEKVVERVLKKVKKPALALDVAKYPTGLDDKVKDFETRVLLPQQQRGEPQIFGIAGLGGVGKTTLAKELFNTKNSDYSSSCFLFDVRENAGKGSLSLLQKILLKSLTGLDHPINSVAEGKGIIKKHLSSSKALIVIDDVDHEDQIDALLPHQTEIHSDSLILITSRDRHVIISSKVEDSSIYTLNGLSQEHSLELFCSYAFNRPYPPQDFEYLVKKFLEACDGLPLSLKVFGALLNGRDAFYWKDQLNKLGGTLPSEIKEKLKISYDALEEDEKKMFLDIACFFIGEDRDMAIRIWGEGGLCGFQNIEDKCIVEMDSRNKIKMHDHLRDLGRELAKASELPRRLWRWTEDDMEDLLQQSSVTAVRGFKMVDMEYTHIDDNICMRRLQLLDAEGDQVEHILTKVQSPNLIWLRWNNCPFSVLPSSISLKNLRVLHVRGSKLETLWEEESQAPLQLRELQIDAPFLNIPKSIGRLKHLERIVIGPSDKVESLVPLTELPEGFCLLQSLKALVLESCSKIKSLPECFGKLTNLHHIQLFGWSALERLPESFGNLTNLQQMKLVRCGALQRLAETFGHLSNLQQIELSGCSALERLPESFGNLNNLQQIELSECSALERLPESFGNLSNLRQIKLLGCHALERLPDSFGKLIKLQYLDLKGCTNLIMSSQTLGDICTLEYINLTGCGKIEVLPAQVACQSSLEQLRLGGTNLKELPSAIEELSDLEVLVVGGPLLETLPPWVCGLNNLKELQLYECRKLKCLPSSLGELKNLKELRVEYCNALNCLPSSLGELKNLKELRVEYCNALNCLPASLGDLNNLKKLTIWCCPELKCLPDSIGRLPQLTDLYIYDSPWIRELLSTLNDLSSSIHNCILPRLHLLSLALIGISEVSFAQGVCSNLQSLRITSCDSVVEVGTLPNTLIYLTFLTCYNLRRVDKICGLAQLQYLDIRGCIELEELPRIETLVSLRQLRAGGCVKLKSIRGLGQMTQLHSLAVDRCSELEELEGIHDCMSLVQVCVGETPKLQWGAGVLEQLRQRCSVWDFDHLL